MFARYFIFIKKCEYFRTDEEKPIPTWKHSHWREMKFILDNVKEGVKVVQCCPSVLEMVEKKGGRNLRGRYVHLYRDGENKQLLYELSCAPGVVDKPCLFVDARLYNQSVCVQKYSYTYALVRDSADTEMPQYRNRSEKYFNVTGTGGWSMDHIEVRAGCECQITPPKRKMAHRRRQEKQRHKRKNKKFEEDDDT